MAKAPRELVITVADQAVLSAQSFVIGGIFVAIGEKSEYSSYVLVFGLVLLAGGLQNALVSMPFTSIASRLSRVESHEFREGVFLLQALGALAIAATIGIGILIWERAHGHSSVDLAMGGAVAVLGSWLREFRRTEQILEGRIRALITSDGAATSLALLGVIGLGAGLSALNAKNVLLTVGVAGVATGISIPRVLGLLRRGELCGKIMRAAIRVGGAAKWTGGWTILTWLQNSSYPYAIALLVGPAAVADTSAARILMGPVALIGTAWGRLFLPSAGRLIEEGEDAQVLRRARRAALALAVVIALYTSCVVVASSAGMFKSVLARYQGIETYVVIWAACFLCATTRGIASISLFAHHRFANVFRMALLTVPMSIAAMFALGRAFGANGVLLAVALGEGTLAVIMWRALTDCTRTAHVRAIDRIGDELPASRTDGRLLEGRSSD